MRTLALATSLVAVVPLVPAQRFVEARKEHLGRGPDGLVAVADFDGDGNMDIAGVRTLEDAHEGCIWWNDGHERFAPTTVLRADRHNYTTRVVVADIDGDGDEDLLFGTVDDWEPLNVRYLANLGGRAFRERQAIRIPDLAPRNVRTRRMLAADGDGDGDRDLLFGELVFENEGSGRLTGRAATPSTFSIDDAGDLDGDGDIDLIGYESGFVARENLGSWRFEPPRLISPYGQHAQALLVDADADGDLDVCFAHYNLRSELWRNDGRGNFTDVSLAAFPPAAYGLRPPWFALDVDGDGDLDLIDEDAPDAVYYGPGSPDPVPFFSPRLYRNAGRGVFVDDSSRIAPETGLFSPLGVADLDRDGDVDVVGGGDDLYFNDGTGRMVEVGPSGVRGPNWYWVGRYLAADLDGDGWQDLLAWGGASCGTPVRRTPRCPPALRSVSSACPPSRSRTWKATATSTSSAPTSPAICRRRSISGDVCSELSLGACRARRARR